MRVHACCVALVAAGCGDDLIRAAAPPDAGARAACDPARPFGPFAADGESTAVGYEMPTRLSPDELTAYASVYENGGRSGATDVYVATRARVGGPFGPPARLGLDLTGVDDRSATVSADGLTLLFESYRLGTARVFIATRATTRDDFGPASLLAPVAAPDPRDYDYSPFLSSDGQELWFVSTRGQVGGMSLWSSRRTAGSFAAPIEATNLFEPYSNTFAPVLSADRLTLYFSSDRVVDGLDGADRVWVTHRASIDDDFPAPALVPELVRTNMDVFPASLSADGCRLYVQTVTGAWVTANDVTAR